MDTSVSSQLDSSLQDSETGGEENLSDSNASPSASTQVSLETESSVTVVQLPDGQTLPIQRVIQAPQTSVIQAPQVHNVQITPEIKLEGKQPVADTQKRREILSRRPSYRKILNELSSDSPAVDKIEEETAEDEVQASSNPPISLPNSIYQSSSGPYIAVTQDRGIALTSAAVEALHGVQTLTVANSPTPQPTATFLQAGESPQHFYIHGGQVLIQGECT
uniref:KID domain-containing protein n=1 Tax=Oryzias latipes TaxID=8090 RepID=A0A3P9JBZ4_ORYLA